jgi:hypothetical protein
MQEDKQWCLDNKQWCWDDKQWCWDGSDGIVCKWGTTGKARKPCHFFPAFLAEELGGSAVGVQIINKLNSGVGSLVMGLFTDGAKLDEEQAKCGSSAVLSQTPLARKSGDLAGVRGGKNVIAVLPITISIHLLYFPLFLH